MENGKILFEKYDNFLFCFVFYERRVKKNKLNVDREKAIYSSFFCLFLII